MGNKSNTPRFKLRNVCHEHCWKNPTVKTVQVANEALRKLKSKRADLKFANLGNPSKLKVISYSDATYASLADGSSQGAFIVLLKGENNVVAAINWQYKKLNRVIKSPLASEALPVNEDADARFLVAALLQEIFKLSFLYLLNVTQITSH